MNRYDLILIGLFIVMVWLSSLISDNVAWFMAGVVSVLICIIISVKQATKKIDDK
jgi:hypothetical protein